MNWNRKRQSVFIQRIDSFHSVNWIKSRLSLLFLMNRWMLTPLSTFKTKINGKSCKFSSIELFLFNCYVCYGFTRKKVANKEAIINSQSVCSCEIRHTTQFNRTANSIDLVFRGFIRRNKIFHWEKQKMLERATENVWRHIENIYSHLTDVCSRDEKRRKLYIGMC